MTIPRDPRIRRANKAAGAYLASLRERADLTQLAVAKVLDLTYHTRVSTWEQGAAPVPAEYWAAMADLYGVPAHDLARVLLQHYHPAIFAALFVHDNRRERKRT